MAGPWEKYGGAQPTAPVEAPGLIRGRPKPVDPYKEQDQAYKAQDQQFQAEDNARKQSTDEFTKFDKLRSDFDALQPVKSYKSALPSYMTALKTPDTPQGDLALIYAFAKVMDPDSVVREGEAAAVASSDTLAGQTVAALKKQLTGTGTFSPEARMNLRRELQNKVSELNRAYNTERSRFKELASRFGYQPDEVIGKHFGSTSEQIIQDYWDKQRGANRPEMRGDVPVGTEVTFGDQDGGGFDRGAYLRSLGIDPNQEASVMAFYNANRGNENLTAEDVLKFYADLGARAPDPTTILQQVEDARAGKAFGPIDTSQAEADYRAKVEQAAGNDAGFGTRADTGITFGLSDEAAGVGGAIGSALRGDNIADGYRFSRDVERQRQQQADANTGLAGDAVEIGSSMLLPFGAARTAGQAARVGATAGAVGGFGYGEGAKGSGLNALLGAGAGAALGAGAQKAGNALATRAANRAAQGQNTNALLQAGQDVGVTVNRAMVEPALQSKVTGVSGTMAGSRIIENDMGKIGGQIEGAVGALGKDGQALSNEVGGGMVRKAAERQIKKSGAAAKRIYDQADKVSQGIKVKPKEAAKRVDEVISQLSETPGTNKAEIAYLETLKSDLSKDLSVGGLRRLRTKLRKSISKGDLVFGENEADVLSVMQAASSDIEQGLVSQGKEGAAKLFRKADDLYRQRAQYIEGTLQKLIGKRNATLSDEQVFAKFKAFSDPKGNGSALSKFMSELTQEESADVAATFAAELGRNPKGEFSTAYLVNQAEKLQKNQTALRTIFGDDGAKSLTNLIALSKEHARVTNAARGSQTGIRSDYKSWLWNLLVSGGAGLATGISQGSGTGAVTAGLASVAGAGVKVAKDALTANALMSPKITGWLRSAPRTAKPAAINAHFAKLSAIAKAEPALANDIELIRNAIMQAANDNANKAVAEDSKSESMR